MLQNQQLKGKFWCGQNLPLEEKNKADFGLIPEIL